MGLFDKMKNFVTGGGAEIKVEHAALAFPSMPLSVKVTVVAKTDIKAGGVFIDVYAGESASIERVKPGSTSNEKETVSHSAPTFSQAIKVHDDITFKEGETRTFEHVVMLPKEAQPTFIGKSVKHTWQIRGRLEMSGNDPDSGYKEIKVGAMS